jgi:hypothetical protein
MATIRQHPTRTTGGSGLTTAQVWHALERASFAVIAHNTPAGDPRSSGVLYRTEGHRLWFATDPRGWKTQFLTASPRISVTVTIRRGGLLSLVAPIPPATVSFHGTAVVHPAGTMAVPDALGPLLPPDRRTDVTLVEVVPEAEFLCYGVGVRLLDMRTPSASRARVPVMPADG